MTHPLSKTGIAYGLCLLLSLFGSRRTAQALGSGALSNQSGVSARAMGFGYAFAGVADDASAIFFNPGGLTQSKGTQLMTGAAVLSFASEHTASQTTEAAPAGQKDKMASKLPIAPYFYLSYSRNESPWAFGIGANSPFGLITEWKDDSFSKYYATKSKILMYMLNPTVAYAVNDRFSVGGGLDYFNVFDAELDARVSPLAGGTGDGHSKLTGDGSAWGYNLGLHYKVNERHSLGLSYRSQANVIIKGKAELSDLSGAAAGPQGFGANSFTTGASTELIFPQSILIGYGFKPTDKWTFTSDYEWANWNKVTETKFNYDNNPHEALPTTVARDWRNSNNVGAGVNYKAREWWDLRFGALIYERVIPSGTLEASLPDSSRWDFTMGTGFRFGDTSIDVGYDLVLFNNRTINNNQETTNPVSGNLLASQDGTFKTTVHIFSLGLTQKWGGKN